MTTLLLGTFTAAFMLGWPVVLAVMIPAVAYVLLNGFPIELIGQRMSYALDSFPLVAVPVFIFVGNLMNQAGITERIYRFATTLVSRVPGGLAQVNIVGSLIFSGMSGAALADVGGLGRIEVKAMSSHGFKREFAGALTCASAIVGPIFPPSIPLIIYGSITNVSIIQLLLAGIVPALICVAMLMITVAILAWRRKFPRAPRWPTLAELWADFLPALPALLTPLLLVSGMLGGFFTPTEAASVTVAYVIVISALV
jgi:tripartite ATP-independent transporter DctM subunit